MERICSNCIKWSDRIDSEGNHYCNLIEIYTRPKGGCPGCKTKDMSEDDYAKQQEEARQIRERVLAMAGRQVEPNKQTTSTKQKPKLVKSSIKKEETEREELVEVKLFNHQIEARNKFKDKDEIALFFEMGCGKTLTSMMIVCDKFNAGIIDSVLIIAPNDVHKQWFDDLCDDESVLSKAIKQEGVESIGQIIGGRKGQKTFYDFDDDKKLHIVCVNVDTFSTQNKWKPIVEWANHNKTAIIIDEATSIKNPSSMRAQRILYEFNQVIKKGKRILYSEKINPVRMVLTGTPVTNGSVDLWAIMEFVKPNFFNRNYYSFTSYYGMYTQILVNSMKVNVLLTEATWRGIKETSDFAEANRKFGCSEDTFFTVHNQDKYFGPFKHVDELKKALEPVAVFAKLVDCVDMPPCNYIKKEISLSPSQQTAYDGMKKDMIAVFGEHISTAKNKLVVSVRLQQISSGFMMSRYIQEDDFEDEERDLMPDEIIWLDKMNPRLEQLLRDVNESDKPVIIFTRFSAEAAKIYDTLKDVYSTCLITGWRSVGSIDEFKEGKYQVLVANIAKLARGFNLQCAHTTIYYSNTFSMELRLQSEFRTFRMGQKYPCTYIDYVSCDIDRAVYKALTLKKNLLDYVRDKDIKEII